LTRAEIAGRGALWLVCSLLGAAVNLELWPAPLAVLLVFGVRLLLCTPKKESK
jgi:hypothetical protein